MNNINFIEKLALKLGYGSPCSRPRHSFKVYVWGQDAQQGEKESKIAKGIIDL